MAVHQDESCSKGIQTVLANTVRGVAIAVFGTAARDKMYMAEMSVTASICELVQAENTSKRELSAIVDRVRATQESKSKSGLKNLLLKSRVLRSTLATMGKKRMGMEKQLETLRQSQLNQNMLLSMKHTSEALQTMGMKVSEADNIMLDLEDSASDLNSLQTTLSSNFMDSDLSDTDLSEELALILSDDSMEPVIHRQSQTTKQIVSPHSVRNPREKEKQQQHSDDAGVVSSESAAGEQHSMAEVVEVCTLGEAGKDDSDGGAKKGAPVLQYTVAA